MVAIELAEESPFLDFKKIPKTPGVYKFLGNRNQPLYIGKAKNLNSRLRSYFSRSSSKNQKIKNLVEETRELNFTKTNNELDALLLEQHLIKEYLPKYNVQFKDGKGYPFIRINLKQEFPSAVIHLGSKKEDEKYFGPYPNRYSVRNVLSLIQKVFKVRNCSESFFKNRNRPCIQYEINKCSAPCMGYVSKKDYSREVNLAKMLLSGKGEHLVKELYEEMDKSSERKQYEKAAKYRDKISSLRDVQRSQSISGFHEDIDAIIVLEEGKHISIGVTEVRGGWVVGHKNYPNINNKLSSNLAESFIKTYYLENSNCPSKIISNKKISEKKILEIFLKDRFKKKVSLISNLNNKDKGLLKIAEANSKKIKRFKDLGSRRYEKGFENIKKLFNLEEDLISVEGFDISHQSGKNAVGSCVSFNREGINKKNYRLFKISPKNSGNDIGSMIEVIERRFKRKKGSKDLPNLLIIDGGETHLNKVKASLKGLGLNDIYVISISKGARRKADMDLFSSCKGIKKKFNPKNSGMLLIQEIRDESHRFCITNLKKARTHNLTQSQLDLIPGIGVKLKSKILRYFGSIGQLKKASVDDIRRIQGIGEEKAKVIKTSIG